MKYISGVFLLSASLLLSSCITESNECPGADSPGGTYLLNIDISTFSPTSRGAGEPMEKGTEEENFINLQDYAVYILDATEEADPEVIERLVVDEIKSMGDGRYKLTGTFTFPEEVHPIRIAAMANFSTDFQGDYDAFTAPGTKLRDLYTNTDPFEFTMPVDVSNRAVVKAWEPTTAEAHPAGIPMFGLSNQVTPKGEFTSTNHSYIPPMDIDIPMLRSLAKIILIDKTPEDVGFRIISASIKDYNSRGRFIPDGIANPQWWRENTQVLTPSLPTQTATESRSVRLRGENDEFYAYVPEMGITAETGRPVLEIHAAIKGGDPKVYEVPIGEYPENQLDEESAFDILRNHRYTFTILNVKEPGIELVIQVVDDWDVIHDMELE